MKDWQNLVVSPQATVLDAMKVIDKNGQGIAIVLNAEGILLGVITDGDIRRGILHEIPLHATVDNVMNSKPRFLPSKTTKNEALQYLEKHKITHIPLVDENLKITRFIALTDRASEVAQINTVVLMVGGLGTRLGDLTTNCPKPMLKVGGKPVLELIVENLKEHGFSDFIFCVNFRAEMIEEYFGNGSSLGVRIRYVHEAKRMGTAGALTLLPDDVEGPLLVMNGDIVTKVNFSSLVDFHLQNPGKATMAVRKYDFQIPYGVVSTDGVSITGIDEKPIQSFLVSAGIYLIETSCLHYVPKDSFFDMPAFFNLMMKEEKGVQAFPIHEYWVDIGREDDLIKAGSEFESFNSEKKI